MVSLIGLRDAFRSEPAFRLELLVLIAVIPAAWILKSAGVERALLIGRWILVLVVEMVNSAIETVVDRIGGKPMISQKRRKTSVRRPSSAPLCLRLLFGYWSYFQRSPSQKG